MNQPSNSRLLVLVLEDEALIALNVQDELQDAGFDVAVPYSTSSASHEWLRTATPGMAILDTTLKDGPCREIALELSRREVPFLIYSGYQQDRQLLSEFDHITWIEKPVPSEVLVQACQQLLVGCD